MKSETQKRNERIIVALAELPRDTPIDKAALAGFADCCIKSVNRAIQRGELPPPVPWMGKPTWTAGAVLGHLNNRLEEAKQKAEQEAERLKRRISELGT